ncbi:isoform 2 of f-box protein [Fagus crenata]
MSDRVIQSYHGGEPVRGEPVDGNKSVWMSHWMRTSCKSATQACSQVSIHYESKEEVHDTKQHPVLNGPDIETEVYAKGFREASKAKAVDFINESLTASSKRLKRKRSDFQSFPMFNLSQKRGDVLALKNDEAICHGKDSNSGHNTVFVHRSKSPLPSKFAWAPPETDTLESHSKPGGISGYSEQLVKSDKDIEMNSLAVSTSLQDNFMRSSLKLVPYGFNSGKTPLQPFVRENKISNQLGSRSSRKSLLSQKDAALLLHDPSTSSNQQAHFIGKQYQNMQNHSGMWLSPSLSSCPEATKSEKLYNGCNSLPRLPCSVHDVETMRIYTTIDSAEGSSRGPSMLSQSTRQFLITKKTDVNLFEGGQMFKESTVSTKFKGKTFTELLGLSPDFQFHAQQGVKLQPLESSIDSDGKENIRDVNASVGLKNESSAETDTMDMDAFQENHLSGVASSPSNKYLKGKSPTHQAVDASAGEEMGGRLLNMELRNINQVLPDLPALSSPVDRKDTSTSRTQSLDAEHLLSHAEHPMTLNSSGCPDDPLGQEPSSRWLKRLKHSASNSGHGTKSSKMGEASSHSKFFSKILKCGITSSELTMGRCNGKELVALDQNATLLRNGESSSVDSVKKCLDVTLSHPWIQRWCHNRTASPQKKPEAVMVCEPQCSKAKIGAFQKKKFPSIAAMALMGKAMCGFQTCEIKKRGSFVVWNTKGVLR